MSDEKAYDLTEVSHEEDETENTEEDSSEQAEVVDEVTKAREECAESAVEFKRILDECNTRVNSRKKTAETCHEEMVDYVQKLDHCALPKAFVNLK